jgi:isoamylase
MILMGDEVRRTQRGNNNAYCQDNEVSWFDWNLINRHAGILRFVRLLIERRLRRDLLAEQQNLSLNELIRDAPHAWHGTKLFQPDWNDQSHSLAFSTDLPGEGLSFYLILNAFWEPLVFELPQTRDNQPIQWRRWIDTFLESPHDIVPWQQTEPVTGTGYLAQPRSVVILVSTHMNSHRRS